VGPKEQASTHGCSEEAPEDKEPFSFIHVATCSSPQADNGGGGGGVGGDGGDSGDSVDGDD